jgi:transcription initiation factor TFIID TATA-box-binding protein
LSSLPKPKIRIENVVASVTVNQRIDLDRVARSLLNVEYDPEQFPGLIYRMVDPSLTFLLFAKVKIVCAGAKSEKDLYRGLEELEKKLTSLGLLTYGIS